MAENRTLGSKKNIVVGAAEVFIGTASAELPVPVNGVSYAKTLDDTAGFESAGFTSEGVEFSNEPEYTGVAVDQLLDEAKLFKTGIRNSLNTTFAEATLENLLVVWGQANDTLSTSGTGSNAVTTLDVVSGELGEAPHERQVVIVGNGVEQESDNRYRERVWRFRRAISVESSSFAARRSEATTYPVSFRLLPGDDGKYGEFLERDRTW